jgi:hypothetical protein
MKEAYGENLTAKAEIWQSNRRKAAAAEAEEIRKAKAHASRKMAAVINVAEI